MLDTNLEHLETTEKAAAAVAEKKNVMVCCGRMGPMCLPVYEVMENVRESYPHVAFYDMEFDGKAAGFIKNLKECQSFMGLPFTVYFKDGKPVHATSSVQSEAQVRAILDKEFGGK